MYNESFSQSFKRGFLGLTVAIRTLIAINVVVYVGMVILQLISVDTYRLFIDALAYYPEWHTTLFQPWRLITYMFLHGGLLHILFNMLWLWWLGRSVEERLGPRTFTVLYFAAGIGGALIDLVFAPFLGFNPVIGASGAITGVMVAFAVLYPNMPIMLFLFPPIPAKYFIAGLIAINVLFIGAKDNTARIVHLGGALIGYLLIKAQKQGTDLGKFILPLEQFWYRIKNTLKKEKSQPANKNMYSVSDVEIIDESEQTELDAILEKISEKGYDGLSKEEKKKLFELSKRN